MAPMKVDPVKLCEMWNNGELASAIADQFGVSRTTVWKWVQTMDLPRRRKMERNTDCGQFGKNGGTRRSAPQGEHTHVQYKG